MKVLAGDIGGTNSRLAIFDRSARGLVLGAQKTYPSAEFGCVADIISDFLTANHSSCDVVCLGLPGPVSTEPIIQLTNLPWQVDHERIRRASGTENVALINDVEASAIGVRELAAQDTECLHRAVADSSGNRAVISVGTGLGVAGLTADGRAFATEAGHASFAPSNDFDYELLRSLSREYGHVSWERVASGPALTRLHSFVTAGTARLLDPPEIVARAGRDEACRQTVKAFCRYVGSAAGNIALTMMATGGVYFCGGVAPRIFEGDAVATILGAFFDKGRMRKVLERMPVYLVRDDNLALTGAAHIALRFAGRS